MAIYKIGRYQVRAEARETAERAMHELASYVRKDLPGTMWNVYRDMEAPGYELVTSSDLQRRHRR